MERSLVVLYSTIICRCLGIPSYLVADTIVNCKEPVARAFICTSAVPVNRHSLECAFVGFV